MVSIKICQNIIWETCLHHYKLKILKMNTHEIIVLKYRLYQWDRLYAMDIGYWILDIIDSGYLFNFLYLYFDTLTSVIDSEWSYLQSQHSTILCYLIQTEGTILNQSRTGTITSRRSTVFMDDYYQHTLARHMNFFISDCTLTHTMQTK